jgi:hypothetical protein
LLKNLENKEKSPSLEEEEEIDIGNFKLVEVGFRMRQTSD